MDKKTFNLKKFSQTDRMPYYQMSLESWEETFKPVVVHPEGVWGGWMLDYSDEEDLTIIQNTERSMPEYLWTILDNQTIMNGYYTVNRFGYIITEVPYANNVIIEVSDDEANELDNHSNEGIILYDFGMRGTKEPQSPPKTKPSLPKQPENSQPKSFEKRTFEIVKELIKERTKR